MRLHSRREAVEERKPENGQKKKQARNGLLQRQRSEEAFWDGLDESNIILPQRMWLEED